MTSIFIVEATRMKPEDTVNVLWYPENQTCWHDEAVYVSGPGKATVASASQRYDTYTTFSDSSNNGSSKTYICLGIGTYTLHVLGVTTNGSGGAKWYLDAVQKGSTQDWYSSSLVYNVVKSITGISITESKIYELKGEFVLWNPSSLGREVRLTKYWFEKTA